MGSRLSLGKPAMINAHQEGIPDNGKPFPDGVAVVKRSEGNVPLGIGEVCNVTTNTIPENS